jgi:sigma-B regulation protein RsbU (phosphoserine phosphatase)
MGSSKTMDSKTREQIFDLQGKIEKLNFKLHDMATMGTLITSILDFETILSVVMEMSIRMVDAEVGIIQLEENNSLISKINWGIDDSIIKNFIYTEDQNIAEYCFKNQEPAILRKDIDDFNFGPTVSSVLSIPIKSRSKCHGVLTVVNKNNEGYFTIEDQENLDMLVNFAAVAIDNAILLKESLQKQKFEQELAIARQIQQAILPSDKIEIHGIDMGTFYRPARYVSGDFYDIIKISETDVLIVVGDVSNKGVPAAIVMAATTAIIRSELMKNAQIKPSRLMFNLNNVLCNGVIKDNDMFATLFIARVNLKERKLIYCNAGHNPPMFWDSSKRDVFELPSGGTFVGQFADIGYKEGTRDINEGDRLLAFTDGVTEAEDVNKEQFGINRLKEIFINNADLSANDFCVRVVDGLDKFTKGASEEPFDDITLLDIAMLKD